MVAQRDQLFMKETKNDAEFRKDLLCENQMIAFQTQLKKYLSHSQI